MVSPIGPTPPPDAGWDFQPASVPETVTDHIDTAPSASQLQVTAGNAPELPIPLIAFLRDLDEAISSLQEALQELLKQDAETSREFNLTGALRGLEFLLSIASFAEGQERLEDELEQGGIQEATDNLNAADESVIDEVNQQNAARANFLNPPTPFDEVNALRQAVIDAFDSGDEDDYEDAAEAFNNAVNAYNSEVQDYNLQTNEYNNAVAEYIQANSEYILNIAETNQQIFQDNIVREENGEPLIPYQGLPPQFFINPEAVPSDFYPGVPLEPGEPAPDIFELLLQPLFGLNLVPGVPSTLPQDPPFVVFIDPAGINALLGPPIQLEDEQIPAPPQTPGQSSPDSGAPEVEEIEEGTTGSFAQNLFEDFAFSNVFFGNILQIAFGRDADAIDAELLLRSLVGSTLGSGNREVPPGLEGGILAPGAFAALTNSLGLSNNQIEAILSASTLNFALEGVFNRVDQAIPQSIYDAVLQPLVSTVFRSSLLSLGSASTVAGSLATSIESRAFANNAIFALGFAGALLGVQGSNTLETLFAKISASTPLNPTDQAELTRALGLAGAFSLLSVTSAELGQGLNTPGLLLPAIAVLLATKGTEESIRTSAGVLVEEQQQFLSEALTRPIEIILENAGIEDPAQLARDFALDFSNGVIPSFTGIQGLSPTEFSALKDVLIETALIGIITESFAESIEDYAQIVRDNQRFRTQFYDRLIDQGLAPERANELAEQIQALVGQIASLTELRAQIYALSAYGEGTGIYSAAISVLTELKISDLFEQQVGGASGEQLAGAYNSLINNTIEELRNTVAQIDEDRLPSAFVRFIGELQEPGNFLDKLNDNGVRLVSAIHQEQRPQVEGISGANDRDIDIPA